MFWLLVALIRQPVTFAAGRVEHHQITSKILAAAGQVANRELSVYLPEEYDTSQLAYPALYLLHGTTGTNRTFLGAGYGRCGLGGIHVNSIVDKLIEDRKIKPLIVVLPNLDRGGGTHISPFDRYLVQEVMPFVESTYRIISHREGRAISGHSRGGQDALQIAVAHAGMFSFAGGYGAGYIGGTALPGRDELQANKQGPFPLQFWIYVGRNDGQPRRYADNQEFVQRLKEVGLPVTYVEDDGDHFNRVAEKLEESIIFFSERLGGGVIAVQPRGKLAMIWGEMKRGQN